MSSLWRKVTIFPNYLSYEDQPELPPLLFLTSRLYPFMIRRSVSPKQRIEQDTHLWGCSLEGKVQRWTYYHRDARCPDGLQPIDARYLWIGPHGLPLSLLKPRILGFQKEPLKLTSFTPTVKPHLIILSEIL